VLLYLSSDEKSGIADFVEEDLQFVLKKLVGKFSLKLFVSKDMRNYTGCMFFLVDANCVEEQLEDFIVAVQSLQMMSDARIIVILSGMNEMEHYIEKLLEIDVMDIITADSANGVRDELSECLSPDGMQRYRLPRKSTRQQEPATDFDEKSSEGEVITKYNWNCKNVKIAIAGTQRRSGVTVTAFNMVAWLIARGATACYVEANTHHHLSWIINVYDAPKNGEGYSVGGIDCYFTDEFGRGYNFVIYDCGEIKEPSSIFREAEARLLCGSILPQEIQSFASVSQACKDYEVFKMGLCVPFPLQEFCRSSLGEDILIAKPSHDLFENNINEEIYMPMVEKYKM
jgi:hypothetical protein